MIRGSIASRAALEIGAPFRESIRDDRHTNDVERTPLHKIAVELDSFRK
jgi:hypothetical protein